MQKWMTYKVLISFKLTLATSFFSREPTELALNTAQRHLAENYVVVGVAEEYLDFLKVLEKLLPGYFTGIVEQYQLYTERKYLNLLTFKNFNNGTTQIVSRPK